MKVVRVVAFALNLLLLFTTGVFIVQRGTRMEEMPIIVLMASAPLVSMFAPRNDGCHWDWLHTSTLGGNLAERLSVYDGMWCVPASPYANTRGALDAIRFARQTGCPFLGTCGGFQHALLEYAEAIWGVRDAAHAALDPQAPNPVIAPLVCSLVEQTGQVRLVRGSV
jgi:hypothetical protein